MLKKFPHIVWRAGYLLVALLSTFLVDLLSSQPVQQFLLDLTLKAQDMGVGAKVSVGGSVMVAGECIWIWFQNKFLPKATGAVQATQAVTPK